VWLGDKKIAAVGIAVNSGITQHGVAINVCPDLSYFGYIIPCGLRNKGVTSMKAQGVGVPSLQEVRDRFLHEFSTVFEVEVGEGNCSAGIQVSAIAPGIVETDTAKSVFPEFALKE
jgi:lipoyl(octanoyl) transferase